MCFVCEKLLTNVSSAGQCTLTVGSVIEPFVVALLSGTRCEGADTISGVPTKNLTAESVTASLVHVLIRRSSLGRVGSGQQSNLTT